MPIVIGAKQESDFSDPIGLLSDCHRRIERFLSTLRTIAQQAHGAEMNADQRLALEAALKYFREAAPKHTADEEESLFPHLHRMQELPSSISERIALLEKDHGQATMYHDQVDRIGRHWLIDGKLPTADLQALTSALAALTDLYREHLAIEDTVLFPFASEVLSDSEKEAIGRDMAMRRGLDPHVKRPR